MLGACAVLCATPAAAVLGLLRNPPPPTWLDPATIETALNSGIYNYNAGANWVSGTAPVTSTDSAVFGISATNNIAVTANTDVDGWTFNPGASAYTIRNDGALQFLGAGIVVDGGSVSITSNGTLTFSGSSSAGSASITNTSGLSFADSSTAESATIANNGNLAFTNSSTAGSANITNTGGTDFYNSSSAGSATITNGFSAYLYFHDSSTAGSATITNNNDMQFSGTASAGSATITNTYAGVLQFNNSATAENATINNQSNVNNTGTVKFNNAASAGSSTINNNGSVQFNNSASAGSSTINNSGTVSYFNSAGGDPTTEFVRIINTSTGAIDVSSHSGTTHIGSVAGGGTITLGSKTLQVGGNNDSTTFDGVISGVGGSLNKVGTGTLTLTAHNSFTGTTTVDAGTLLSTNWLSSDQNVVNSGGTLGGMGNFTATKTQINAGGTLAPGTPSAMGSMQFQSQVVFTPGSFYQVKIDGTSSDFAQTATTNLGNAVVKVKPVGVITQTTNYTILSSAFGFGGSSFSSAVIDGAPLARNPTLSYSGGNVILTVDAGLLSYIIPSTSTANQKSIAAAIDAALIGGAPLPPGFQALFNLIGPQLLVGLNQVNGQNAAGAKATSSDAMNSMMNALFDSFLQGRAGGSAPGSAYASVDDDEALGYAKRRKFTRSERDARNAVTGRNNIYDPRWSVWGSAYGGASKTIGDAAAGSADTTSSVFGFVTGADYNVNARTTVGFALGGGGSNFATSGGLGSGHAEMFQLGLFAKHTMGAAYVSGGLGYTFQNVTTDRTVTVAGTDQLRATFNANTFSARGEAGYRFATPVVGITPYAALQVTNISLPSYGESVVSGNNTFALNYNAQDTTIVRTELGARFDRAFALQTAMLTLRGRAAWAHDEGNNRNISAAFGSLPGSNFAINGAVPSKDLALLSAGADMAWLNNVTLSGLFEGQFSDTTNGYGGKGTVRYVW